MYIYRNIYIYTYIYIYFSCACVNGHVGICMYYCISQTHQIASIFFKIVAGVTPPYPHFVLSTVIEYTFNFCIHPINPIRLLHHDDDRVVHLKSQHIPLPQSCLLQSDS